MKMHDRVLKVLAITALGLMVLGTLAPLSVYANTIQSTDFQSQTFTKVVDWYDYVRQYATANGFTPPNATDHAYIYANYINVGGYQLFYVGLVNVTNNGMFVTVPLQTFFQHFKTPGGKDAITASSFLSLLAFNESSTDAVPNSPDPSDNVYASFSLGVNLANYFGNNAPSYVAGSQVVALTQVGTNHWTWGLKYTNLSAIWWKITPNPLYPIYDPIPQGIARYTELTFNYDLTLDPSAKTAHLTETFTVGKVTDLWVIRLLPTYVVHYNATGSYFANNNTQTPNSRTVYQLLQAGGYKLSIVLANKTVLASHTSTDKDSSGNSVDDVQSGELSRSNVTTIADDNERVFQAEFSAKHTYQLYDPTDANPVTYNVTTRTVQRDGYVKNPLFAFQNHFMGFLPLFVAHVDPGLIQQAKAGLASFTVTDYLYLISYPHWGGTRIVNDPDYTAFYQPASNAGLLLVIFLAVAVAAVVGGVFAFMMRRRKASNMGFTAVPGQTPPTQGPAGPTIPGR